MSVKSLIRLVFVLPFVASLFVAPTFAAGTSEDNKAPRSTNSDPVPPPGPYLTPQKEVPANFLQRMERLAPSSTPTGKPGGSDEKGSKVDTRASGSSTAPYTTKRVEASSNAFSVSNVYVPVSSRPYSPTGKLYFSFQGLTYVCSASLIRKGVLVTAAHCVHDYGLGDNGWHSNFVWCPALTSSQNGPYGCYSASNPRIANVYKNGTDTCSQKGVVCNNDLATLIVAPKNNVYAGTTVGTYGWSWNAYAFKSSTFLGNVKVAQITQLGYPQAFDSGVKMQRTDAVGWYSQSGDLKNIQIGSAQTGGSSGGPWIVNFGVDPSIDTTKASLGDEPVQYVAGVTSYGATTKGYNRQGASFFGQNKEFPDPSYVFNNFNYGAGNIGAILRDTCQNHSTHC